MTSSDPARPIFDLLPAVYRERDARPDGQPGFLQSLLAVIADQLALVDADLDQLYDDLFIETCSAWVVPYIGDLVAVTPGAPTGDDSVLTRAAVANAIALRRRKGTAAVLEQLARDYTGWPAVAVEMFERMAVAQHLHHVVPTRGRTVALRAAAALEQVGRSFDSTAHTLEVRRIGSARGRHDIQNVAIMVWRDALASHTWVDACAVDGKRFRFHPLGWDQSLATQPRTEITVAHKAGSLNVPGSLTRRAMVTNLPAFYGAGLSVAVRRSGELAAVPLHDVVVCDLGDSAPGGASWSNVSRLAVGEVGIDPQRGRLAFGKAQAAPPLVSFVTTSPSDTGGSELRERPGQPNDSSATRVRRDGTGAVQVTIAAALAVTGGQGTIRIEDSRTYGGDLAASVPAEAALRVVGSRGSQPVIDLTTAWTVTVAERGVLSLTGLVVAGGALVVRGRPDLIEITDCTFVPGQRLGVDAEVSLPVGPSIVLELDPDWQTELRITNCITGPLLLPADGTTVSITDSIVDGVGDGLGPAAAAGARARVVPVLRSPTPLTGLNLPVGSTALRVILGTDAPRLITLSAAPGDVGAAAMALDQALTGTGARAFAAADRLVLIGDGRPLSALAEPGSGLADGLGLIGPAARTRAILGGAPDLVAAALGGELTATDRRGTTHHLHVASGGSDLGSLAGRVQSAVRAADPGLVGVVVGTIDEVMVVVPADAHAVTFAPAATDLTTAAALGLMTLRPAVAADPSGVPGATLTLTRCTVLGSIVVTAVDLVTDSIVTGPLVSDRRQVGCVQYSWIAPGSSTARLHECQPATADTPPPRFVSQRYATPGYGRVRRTGASAIVRGASDGYEMGAMARLRQTQRDDNLRRAVGEFLRFGLEAGVLDGT